MQGNLDPLGLFAPPDRVETAARNLLQATDGMAHIFNLGHGVHPETPYASVERLVQTVKGHVTG